MQLQLSLLEAKATALQEASSERSIFQQDPSLSAVCFGLLKVVDVWSLQNLEQFRTLGFRDCGDAELPHHSRKGAAQVPV